MRDHAGLRCVVIVVSFRSEKELAPCLDSLLEGQGVPVEIHVVDNASGDGSAELVRRRFPSVHLHANTENVGFGRANNQILETVPADFYVLVNPDTVSSPGTIGACVEFLEEHGDVGVVAPRLVYPDGSLHPSCHSFPSTPNLLGEALLLDRAFPEWRAVSGLNLRSFAHDREVDVDWIQGAYLVVRGDVVRQVGGFDPQFFVNGEEMEWCFRVRQAGWRVVFLPGPTVSHVGGASTRTVAGPMFVESMKGRLRFLEKHRGKNAVWEGRWVLAAGVVARRLAYEVLSLAWRVRSRPVPDSIRFRVEIFRYASRWVRRGLPLTPPFAETRAT